MKSHRRITKAARHTAKGAGGQGVKKTARHGKAKGRAAHKAAKRKTAKNAGAVAAGGIRHHEKVARHGKHTTVKHKKTGKGKRGKAAAHKGLKAKAGHAAPKARKTAARKAARKGIRAAAKHSPLAAHRGIKKTSAKRAAVHPASRKAKGGLKRRAVVSCYRPEVTWGS